MVGLGFVSRSDALLQEPNLGNFPEPQALAPASHDSLPLCIAPAEYGTRGHVCEALRRSRSLRRMKLNLAGSDATHRTISAGCDHAASLFCTSSEGTFIERDNKRSRTPRRQLPANGSRRALTGRVRTVQDQSSFGLRLARC